MSSPRSPYRLLLPALVLLFILISVAEVWVLTAVGTLIGVVPTVMILIAEALVGSWLLRREGRKSWQALVAAYGSGRMPTGQLADAALVLTGGTLLIVPGFFTDLLGLVFMVPFTRRLSRKGLGWLVARYLAGNGMTLGQFQARGNPSQTASNPSIVKGEVVEDQQNDEQPRPEPTATQPPADS